MKVLVSGASGMIGSAVVEQLLAAGHQVTALVHPDESESTLAYCQGIWANAAGRPRDELLEPGPHSLHIIKYDIRSCPWGQLLDQCDAVVHLAALVHDHNKENGWADYEELNIKVVEDLCRAICKADDKSRREDGSRPFPGLVFVSTFAVYGDAPEIGPDGGLVLNPASMYARSKRQAEEKILQLLPDDAPYWILRPAMVYGPLDRGNMARMVEACRHGRFIIPGSGNNRKHALYAADLARIIAACLVPGALMPGIYPVLNHHPRRINDMVAAIQEVWGSQRPVPHLPMWLGRTAAWLGDRWSRFPLDSRTLESLSADQDFSAYSTIQTMLHINGETSLAEGLAAHRNCVRIISEGQHHESHL